MISARRGITGTAVVFSVMAILGVAVVSGLYLAFATGPKSQTSSTPSLSTSTSSATTIAQSAFSFSAQAMNSSIIIPTSGRALVDFHVNSTVSGTFYFEAIPNDTIPVTTQVFFPGETNAPFPIPDETLPAGLNASYPNGQVLSGSSQGVLAVEMAAAATTPPGSYTLYLCVLQQSGSGGTDSVFPFTVDVTRG